MLTDLEAALVTILKALDLTQQEVIGIMLMLKETPKDQEELLKFLRNNNPKELTARRIIDKVLEITDRGD